MPCATLRTPNVNPTSGRLHLCPRASTTTALTPPGQCPEPQRLVFNSQLDGYFSVPYWQTSLKTWRVASRKRTIRSQSGVRDIRVMCIPNGTPRGDKSTANETLYYLLSAEREKGDCVLHTARTCAIHVLPRRRLRLDDRGEEPMLKTTTLRYYSYYP